MKREPCHSADGRGKLAWWHRADARNAARNLGVRFDGQKKAIYHCSVCNQYHLATRKK